MIISHIDLYLLFRKKSFVTWKACTLNLLFPLSEFSNGLQRVHTMCQCSRSIIHPGMTLRSCYFLHKCEVNQSAVSLLLSNPLNGSKTVVIYPRKLNIKFIIKFNIFWPEHIFCSVKCHSIAVFCGQSEATGERCSVPVSVEFSPVLASGPITQLTCLLTRSPFLRRTAFSMPGCLYSWGLFPESKY